MFERKGATPATPGPREKVHGTFQRVALQGVTRFTVFIGIVLAGSGVLQWLLDVNRPLTLKRIAFGAAFLAVAGVARLLAARTSPRWGTFFQLGAMLVAMGAYAGWTGRGLDSQMLAGGAILITMTGALLSFGAAATVGALQLVQVAAVYRWVLDASGARAPAGDLVAHLLLVLGALVAAWVLSRLMSGALQAALTSRVEIEAVIDEAPVGIATIRLGRFQLVNEQLREMLGASREALVGQPVDAVFLKRLTGTGANADRLLDRLEADRLLDLDCKLQPPDRPPADIHLRARALPLADAGAAHSVWVVEDVTRRSLQQRELAQAKAAAETANRAKSAFLASMSHEIRTPLNGVIGLARLLRDDALTETRRREYVDHLVSAADLLSGLLDDILDMSKIEAGEMTLEHIPYAVRDVVQQAFTALRWRGEEKGLRMSARFDPAVPERVRGDPVRLRQIVLNFLSNAVKFTDAGEVGLELSAPAPGRLRIAVRDTGPGVSAAATATLFTPFTQAETSTSRRFGGSGLGLAICRSLAEKMNGRVGMTPNPGAGSTFWLELPVETVLADEPPSAPPPSGSLLAGATVLVVDDNAVNRLVAAAMLERSGATVVEAHDGFEAIERVRRHAPTLDLVLMDLYMPGCDGFEAARSIHRLAGAQALPIVALSASVLHSEREAARDAGMSAFLAKPLIEGELVRVASLALAQRGER